MDIRSVLPSRHPASTVGWSLIAFATVAVLIAEWTGVPYATLLRDPAAEFDVPVHAGMLSFLGIALLIATAFVTAFAASLAPAHRVMLWLAAVLSGAMAVDDRFMLHERIGPSRLGIPEEVFYLSYGVMAAVLVLQLVRARADLTGLRIALMFLGASIAADVFKVHGPFSFWLEDFAKLAGFGAWLVFWSGFGRSVILSARVQPETTE